MLRAIAALMVCIFHFTTYIDIRGSLFLESDVIYRLGKLGIQGVYVFFIITGFIIPFSLLKNKFNLNQLHRFLFKRWIRIEIPYLISILLILTISLCFSIKNGTDFNLDIFRLLHHLLYTIPFSGNEWYNPIYWTLAIEMQFYILIAIIYPFLTTKNSFLNYLATILFGLSGLIINDNRLILYYAPIFAQGILLFQIMNTKEVNNKIIGVILILGFSVITFYIHKFDVALVSIITVLIIGVVNVNNNIFNKLGEISYSLYLIHGLIGGNLIYFLGRYAENYTLKILLVIFSILLSIFTSYLYWKFIENPSKILSKNIKLINKSKE